MYFEWAVCLVPRDVLPLVHNIVARTEHRVQRTLPVRTVFFWDVIIRWTRGGGGIVLVCVAHLLYARPCIAFPLLQIKHLCVIFSLQRRCMGVLCCYFRPKMFSPGDHVRYHSHTLGAHVLATVVGPSPNGPQFCHIRYIRPGGVTPVDHESAQLSRLEAVAVESPILVPRSSSLFLWILNNISVG